MSNNRQHTFFQKFIAACWILGVAFFSFGIATSNQSNVRYMNGQANLFSLNQGEGIKWLIQKQIDNLFNPTIEAEAQLPVTVTTCSPLGCLPWIIDKLLKVIISAFVKAILNTVTQFVKKAINELKKAASQFNLFSSISGPVRELTNILSGRRGVCSEIARTVGGYFNNVASFGERPLSPLELGLSSVANRLNSTPFAFASTPIKNGITSVASVVWSPVTNAQSSSSSSSSSSRESEIDAALRRIGQSVDGSAQNKNCQQTLDNYTGASRNLGSNSNKTAVAAGILACTDYQSKGQECPQNLQNTIESVMIKEEAKIARANIAIATGAFAPFDPGKSGGIGALFGGAAREPFAHTEKAKKKLNDVLDKGQKSNNVTQKALETQIPPGSTLAIVPKISKADPKLDQANAEFGVCLNNPANSQDKCDKEFAAKADPINAARIADSGAQTTPTLPDASFSTSTDTDRNLLTTAFLKCKEIKGADLESGPQDECDAKLTDDTQKLNESQGATPVVVKDNGATEATINQATAAQGQSSNPGSGAQDESLVGLLIDQVTTFLKDLGNLLIDSLFSIVNTIAGNICSSLGIPQACTELAAATDKWSANLKADVKRDTDNLNSSLRGSNSNLADVQGNTPAGINSIDDPIVVEKRRKVDADNANDQNRISSIQAELAADRDIPFTLAETTQRTDEIASRQASINARNAELNQYIIDRQAEINAATAALRRDEQVGVPTEFQITDDISR